MLTIFTFFFIPPLTSEARNLIRCLRPSRRRTYMVTFHPSVLLSSGRPPTPKNPVPLSPNYPLAKKRVKYKGEEGSDPSPRSEISENGGGGVNSKQIPNGDPTPKKKFPPAAGGSIRCGTFNHYLLQSANDAAELRGGCVNKSTCLAWRRDRNDGGSQMSAKRKGGILVIRGYLLPAEMTPPLVLHFPPFHP